MEGAAQAVVLAPAEAQVHAAMGAEPVDEAELAGILAKQHEVLAEEPDRHHRALGDQFVGKRGGLPVAAQHIARRRARADAGQLVVLFLAHHGRGLLGGSVV